MVIEAVVITIGFVFLAYSLLKITKSPLAKKIEESPYVHTIVLSGFIITFLLLILPILFYDILRIGYVTSIGHQEGWNAIHTARLLAGKPLYTAIIGFPLTPVNYPPLSFAIIGVLSYLTRDILLTGRAVSIISVLFSTYLIYGTVFNFTSKKSGALLGALLWLAYMLRVAYFTEDGRPVNDYVGSYDPQLLAHVFSFGALYLYSKWIDELTIRKTCILAFLCCFALFIKHLLIAVPITLAISLFFTHRRSFWTFAITGIVISSLMFLGTWLYAGIHLFSNFLDFDRPVSNVKMQQEIKIVFLDYKAWVVFLPFIALLFKSPKKWMLVLIYFSISFIIGSYAFRGTAVSKNAYFDFFGAAAVVFGLLAVESTKLESFWSRILVYTILASCLLPVSIGLRTHLYQVLNFGALKQNEEIYRNDVALLQSFPEPVLFEPLLLGFHAGKEFLFDASSGSMMIVAGRVPEKNLIDLIHEKYFSVIVLNEDIDKEFDRVGELVLDPRKPGLSMGRWTDRTYKVITENYDLLELNRPHRYFFYLPREN